MMAAKSVQNSAGNDDFGNFGSGPVSPAPEKQGGKWPLVSTLCGLLCLVSVVNAAEGGAGQHGPGNPGNLNHLLSFYQSQGLKINRLSTAWRSKSGTLTVGNDWSNFQGFQHNSDDGSGYSRLFDDRPTSEQIAWAHRSGFSIALEESAGEPEAVDENIESLQQLGEGTPNLILSWQGEFADQAGRYKVSAVGRKLNLKGVHDGVAVDHEELGWGVRLAGGWRFGDLFAALRLTLGNGIDSFILRRFGSDVGVSPSGQVETLEYLSILPSLNYSINDHSDFRVSLGRYESRDGEAVTGIDTLDTINLGYTWSPWPTTQFEVEVVSKDFEGAINDEDSTEIKIGAEKRF